MRLVQQGGVFQIALKYIPPVKETAGTDQVNHLRQNQPMSLQVQATHQVVQKLKSLYGQLLLDQIIEGEDSLVIGGQDHALVIGGQDHAG